MLVGMLSSASVMVKLNSHTQCVAITRARHCTWLGSYHSPGLKLLVELSCLIDRHCCARVISLAALTDLLGDTSKANAVVNHEEIHSFLGANSAVNVHDEINEMKLSALRLRSSLTKCIINDCLV